MNFTPEDESTPSINFNDTELEQASCLLDSTAMSAQEMCTSVYVNTEVPSSAQTVVKMSSGTEMPFSIHSIKDYSSKIATLQNENFNLKLRIFEMETNMKDLASYTCNSSGSSDVEKDLNNIIKNKDRLLEKAREAINTMMVNHEEEITKMAENNLNTNEIHDANVEIVKDLQDEITEKTMDNQKIIEENKVLTDRYKLLRNELIDTQKSLKSKMSANKELVSKDIVLDKDLLIEKLNNENKAYKLEIDEKEKSLNIGLASDEHRFQQDLGEDYSKESPNTSQTDISELQSCPEFHDESSSLKDPPLMDSSNTSPPNMADLNESCSFELHSRLTDVACIMRQLNAQLNHCLVDDLKLDHSIDKDTGDILFTLDKIISDASSDRPAGHKEYILQAIVHRRIALECHVVSTRRGRLSIKRLVSNPLKDSLKGVHGNLYSSDCGDLPENGNSANEQLENSNGVRDSIARFKDDDYELEKYDLHDSAKNNEVQYNEFMEIDEKYDYIENDIDNNSEEISEDMSEIHNSSNSGMLTIEENQCSLLDRISLLEVSKGDFLKDLVIKNGNLDALDISQLETIDRRVNELKSDPNFKLYLEQKIKLNIAESEFEKLKNNQLQPVQNPGNDKIQGDKMNMHTLNIADQEVVDLRSRHTSTINNDDFKLNYTIDKLRKAEQKLENIVTKEIQLTHYFDSLKQHGQDTRIDESSSNTVLANKAISADNVRLQLRKAGHSYKGDYRLASIFQGKAAGEGEPLITNAGANCEKYEDNQHAIIKPNQLNCNKPAIDYKSNQHLSFPKSHLTQTQAECAQRLQMILMDRLNKTNQLLDEVIKKDQSISYNTTIGDINTTNISTNNKYLPNDMINSIKDIISETSIFSESFMDQNEIENYLLDFSNSTNNISSLDVNKLDKVIDDIRHMDFNETNNKLAVSDQDLDVHISPIAPIVKRNRLDVPDIETARRAAIHTRDSLNRDPIDSVQSELYSEDKLGTSMEFNKDVNILSPMGTHSYDSIKNGSPDQSTFSMPTMNTVVDGAEIEDAAVAAAGVSEVGGTTSSLETLRLEYEHREQCLRGELAANKQRELTLTNTIAALRNQILDYSQIQTQSDKVQQELGRKLSVSKQRVSLLDQAEKERAITETKLYDDIQSLRNQVLTYSKLKSESDSAIERLKGEYERSQYQLTLFQEKQSENNLSEKIWKDEISSLRKQILEYSQSKTKSDLLEEHYEDQILNLKNKISELINSECTNCIHSIMESKQSKEVIARLESDMLKLKSEMSALQEKSQSLRLAESDRCKRDRRVIQELRKTVNKASSLDGTEVQLENKEISDEDNNKRNRTKPNNPRQVQADSSTKPVKQTVAKESRQKKVVNMKNKTDQYKLNPTITKLENDIKLAECDNQILRKKFNKKNKHLIGREYINDHALDGCVDTADSFDSSAPNDSRGQDVLSRGDQSRQSASSHCPHQQHQQQSPRGKSHHHTRPHPQHQHNNNNGQVVVVQAARRSHQPAEQSSFSSPSADTAATTTAEYTCETSLQHDPNTVDTTTMSFDATSRLTDHQRHHQEGERDDESSSSSLSMLDEQENTSKDLTSHTLQSPKPQDSSSPSPDAARQPRPPQHAKVNNSRQPAKTNTINNVSDMLIFNNDNISYTTPMICKCDECLAFFKGENNDSCICVCHAAQPLDYKNYLRKMSKKIKKLEIENGSLKNNLRTETGKKETVKNELQRLYILMKGNNTRKENILTDLQVVNKPRKTVAK